MGCLLISADPAGKGSGVTQEELHPVQLKTQAWPTLITGM